MTQPSPTVYIPSRGRSKNVAKLLRAWFIDRNHGLRVRFVVEHADFNDYCDAISVIESQLPDNTRVGVSTLPASNQGVGYARNYTLKLAASRGEKSIILSDDDIRPDAKSDWIRFWALAAADDVLGITARYSYHDLALGPGIKDKSGLILLPSGTFRLIALNVKNVMDLGNYDPELTCLYEDGDLMLRGIEAGYPWLIDLGTKANSMGSRYAAGGLSDYFGEDHWAGDRHEAERACHLYLRSKHPKYVNDPPADGEVTRGNGVRVRWQKCYDDNIADWRTLSDLHGGSLRRMR